MCVFAPVFSTPLEMKMRSSLTHFALCVFHHFSPSLFLVHSLFRLYFGWWSTYAESWCVAATFFYHSSDMWLLLNHIRVCTQGVCGQLSHGKCWNDRLNGQLQMNCSIIKWISHFCNNVGNIHLYINEQQFSDIMYFVSFYFEICSFCIETKFPMLTRHTT